MLPHGDLTDSLWGKRPDLKLSTTNQRATTWWSDWELVSKDAWLGATINMLPHAGLIEILWEKWRAFKLSAETSTALQPLQQCHSTRQSDSKLAEIITIHPNLRLSDGFPSQLASGEVGQWFIVWRCVQYLWPEKHKSFCPHKTFSVMSSKILQDTESTTVTQTDNIKSCNWEMLQT